MGRTDDRARRERAMAVPGVKNGGARWVEDLGASGHILKNWFGTECLIENWCQRKGQNQVHDLRMGAKVKDQY
jgi:hypothetical protein